MTNSTDYTAWFNQEIKKLLDLIANRTNPQELTNQINEIRRGVEYGTNNPGSIDDLLLKVGRNFIDSLQVYIRQMKPKSRDIPLGGQATFLAGMGGDQKHSDEQFSVDELKGALASRKKEKVVKKMKGSLDLLKEYEDS
ncbi:MAG: hypothetical protein ACFFB2_03540 [Promethearchaeota archaeon]